MAGLCGSNCRATKRKEERSQCKLYILNNEAPHWNQGFSMLGGDKVREKGVITWPAATVSTTASATVSTTDCLRGCRGREGNHNCSTESIKLKVSLVWSEILCFTYLFQFHSCTLLGGTSRDCGEYCGCFVSTIMVMPSSVHFPVLTRSFNLAFKAVFILHLMMPYRAQPHLQD